MPRTEKNVCVVVDGYSTGKKLPLIFRGRGYYCIHIKSSAELPENLRHNEKDYDESFVHVSIEETIGKLKGFKIKLCVPGYESGVELADKLCETLRLSTSNGIEHSLERRDKFYMGEAVRKAGLKTVAQKVASNKEEVTAWYRDAKRKEEAKTIPESDEKTIILKPIRSANNDGVFFCKDEKDITEAFRKITESSDVFGQRNVSVLAQNHNPGQEYIVNTVAYNGKVMVTEIYEITKLPGTVVYEQAVVIDSSHARFAILSEYAIGVVGAVHIRFGAATVELKFTPTGGPVLLEIAARTMGNSPLSFINDLFGATQLSMMAEAYLNPHLFMQLVLAYKPTISEGAIAVAVVLISNAEGALKVSLSSEPFAKLATFHSCTIDAEAGAVLKKTHEVGEIYLVGTKKAVERDKAAIRQLEADGYYTKALLLTERKSTTLAVAVAGITQVGLLKAPSPRQGLLPGPSSNEDNLVGEEGVRRVAAVTGSKDAKASGSVKGASVTNLPGVPAQGLPAAVGGIAPSKKVGVAPATLPII